MSRLFISHSSLDNAAARAVGNWLTREGFDEYFLDFDPERGIRAGERWERALHDAADRCEAIVFLVGRNWLASEWCGREFDLAVRLSKRIFGVMIDDVPISDIPLRYREAWQFVSLSGGTDHEIFRVEVPPDGVERHVSFSRSGLAHLKAGLLAAGLDPKYFAWPPPDKPYRSPYPGLEALEADDAGIFFGRDAPLVLALDRLREMAGRAPPRLLAILGASGAGKSSFLRAGLWPRLARDDRRFRPLPPIRPLEAAINGEKGLVAALTRAAAESGLRMSRSEISAATADHNRFADLLARLAAAATVPPMPGEPEAKPPTLVLGIDQAEELFPIEDRPEAARLLELLAQVTQRADLSVIVVFTIRTESYERLQSTAAMKALRQEPFSLQPVPQGAYETIIVGPAARLSRTKRQLEIDPTLTETLMRDIEAGGARDALPLLAFTLRRLYDDHGGKGRLTLADYKESGGVAGSIAAAVDKALEEAALAPGMPAERDARLALLRRGLIPRLAGIDPATGEPRRTTALRADLPLASLPLLDRMIDVRLLRYDAEDPIGEAGGSEVSIEVAHEALLRQWPLMVSWLDADRRLLESLAGVRQATRDWNSHGRAAGWLAHAAGRLEDAEELAGHPDLAIGLDEDHRAYLDACRIAENERRNAELERVRVLAAVEARGRRRARIGLVVASAFAVVATAAAWWGLDRAHYADLQSSIARRQYDRANFILTRATETANGMVADLAVKLRDRMGMPLALVGDILTRARHLQRQLTEGGETDPSLRLGELKAVNELVLAEIALGDVAAALREARTSDAAARQMADERRGDRIVERQLTFAMNRLGDALMASGQPSQALTVFTESAERRRAITLREAENVEGQRDLAAALEKIGEAQQALGGGAGFTAASAAFDEALALRRRIYETKPTEADFRSDLSLALERTGLFASTVGDDAPAIALLRECVELRASLVADHPDNARFLHDLAVGHDNLGVATMRSGDAATAMAQFGAARASFEALAQLDASNALWKREHAVSLAHTSDALARSGEADRAIEAARTGAKILAALTNDGAGRPEWLLDLVLAHRRLAALGDDPKSHLSNGLAILKAMRQRGTIPARFESLSDLIEAKLIELENKQ